MERKKTLTTKPNAYERWKLGAESWNLSPLSWPLGNHSSHPFFCTLTKKKGWWICMLYQHVRTVLCQCDFSWNCWRIYFYGIFSNGRILWGMRRKVKYKSLDPRNSVIRDRNEIYEEPWICQHLHIQMYECQLLCLHVLTFTYSPPYLIQKAFLCPFLPSFVSDL